MSDLNPCRKCGAPAVEHIRGEFHASTRNDVPENHGPGVALVEMEKSIEDDYRVACSGVREKDFVPKTIGGWREPFQGCENFHPWASPTLKEVARAKAAWNTMNPVKEGVNGNRQSQ